MHDKDTPPEDKEKWNLDRERDIDALKDYVRIERVIGQRSDEDGEIEYLVKCTLICVSALLQPLILHRERSVLRFLHLGKGRTSQQYRSKRD